MSQLSKAQLITEEEALFPDNTSQAISPEDLRQVVRDMIDSSLNVFGESDIQGVLGYSSDLSPDYTDRSLVDKAFAVATVAAAISDDAYDAALWSGVTTIAPSKNAVRDELELKAYDSLVVHLAGDENIEGLKTFFNAYGSMVFDAPGASVTGLIFRNAALTSRADIAYNNNGFHIYDGVDLSTTKVIIGADAGIFSGSGRMFAVYRGLTELIGNSTSSDFALKVGSVGVSDIFAIRNDGVITISGNLLFSGGSAIDTTVTGGTDTLNIGTANAEVINIGNASATVNILGAYVFEYSVNAYVTDKLMTLNKDGGASTGIGVGFEIEENAIITGYWKTNAARTGFSMKSPANAGVLDIITLGTDVSLTAGNTGIIAVTSDISAVISDTAYDSTSWSGVTTIAPSKNAVRDEFENKVSKTTGNILFNFRSASAFDITNDGAGGNYSKGYVYFDNSEVEFGWGINYMSVGSVTGFVFRNAGGVITMPSTTGTLALTSQITGTNSGTNTGDETTGRINALYGYTPANASALGAASATSLAITGTAGNGFISLISQASDPAAPASGTVIFSNSNSKLSWRGSANNFVKTFDGSAATANRVYSLPDATGTVPLLENDQIFSGVNKFTGLVGIGSGTPVASLDIANNITSAAWTTNGIGLRVRANTYTDNSSSGTVSTIALHSILGGTLNTSSATTATSYANLYVAAPVAGTNLTTTAAGTYAAIFAGSIGFQAGATARFGPIDNNALAIQTNGSTRITLNSNGTQVHTHGIQSSGASTWITYNQPAHSGGSQSGFLWTAGASTSQTTATEITDINYNLSAVLKSIDGTISTQRAFRIQGRTYTPQTSALTLTDAVSFEVNAATAGSGTTITRNWAARLLGNVAIGNSLYIGASAGTTAPTALIHIAAGTNVANTAPIQVANGTRETTARGGLIEYENNWYMTNTNLVRFGVGGSIFDYVTDAGNSTTVETDLYSTTTIASTLGVNNGKIEATYGGLFVSSGTATRQIKIYFAGTAILDTGALTLSLSSAWTAYVTIIRVSSTVIRYTVSFATEGAALAAYTSVGELTGLTLSNTNILKITGTAAGVGAATNDIVAKMGYVEFKSAA